MKQVLVHSWQNLSQDSPMAKLSRRRIIGEKMMISEITLEKGCLVPMHQHENEQFSCVLKGWLRFSIQHSDNTITQYDVRTDQVMELPSQVPHAAEAIEDTLVLDLFSPPSATTGIDVHRRH